MQKTVMTVVYYADMRKHGLLARLLGRRPEPSRQLLVLGEDTLSFRGKEVARWADIEHVSALSQTGRFRRTVCSLELTVRDAAGARQVSLDLRGAADIRGMGGLTQVLHHVHRLRVAAAKRVGQQLPHPMAEPEREGPKTEHVSGHFLMTWPEPQAQAL